MAKDKIVDNINIPIQIKTDGEYLVEVKAIDEAGNRSEISTVNIYKDGTPPEVGMPIVRDETEDGFTITCRSKRCDFWDSKI